MAELPRGRIRVRDTDIGVKSSVVVEVDGEAVCVLNPSEVTRTLSAAMGRSTTTLVFVGGEWNVVWEVGTADTPGLQQDSRR